MPKGKLETPAIAVPISDGAMNSLHILKRWLGGNLSPDIYRHAVGSGMLEPAETRHTMQEVIPPGGMEAWEGRMPATEETRPLDSLIYEGKAYPGYFEQTSMQIPNVGMKEGLGQAERFIEGLLPDLFSPSSPRGVRPRPQPQDIPASSTQPATMEARTPDTHIAPQALQKRQERFFFATPEGREQRRFLDQNWARMKYNAGPPPGPFAQTDDTTLQALSQSLEGALRDEMLKELELRAQRRAEQTLGMQ